MYGPVKFTAVNEVVVNWCMVLVFVVYLEKHRILLILLEMLRDTTYCKFRLSKKCYTCICIHWNFRLRKKCFFFQERTESLENRYTRTERGRHSKGSLNLQIIIFTKYSTHNIIKIHILSTVDFYSIKADKIKIANKEFCLWELK